MAATSSYTTLSAKTGGLASGGMLRSNRVTLHTSFPRYYDNNNIFCFIVSQSVSTGEIADKKNDFCLN